MRSVSKVEMPEDLAVRIENLWLKYKINVESKVTLKNAVMRASRGEKRKMRIIEAVKGLTLDIPHGTVLGIVGANGAGKSTLMRAIAGILPPTEGRIIVNGKVSTLLALGVGFNGSLSGRDNIVLGGLAAGLDRDELDAKFDEIALTYVPSGNGAGEVSTAVFKLASATVATLTLTYDSNNKLTGVVKT